MYSTHCSKIEGVSKMKQNHLFAMSRQPSGFRAAQWSVNTKSATLIPLFDGPGECQGVVLFVERISFQSLIDASWIMDSGMVSLLVASGVK